MNERGHIIYVSSFPLLAQYQYRLKAGADGVLCIHANSSRPVQSQKDDFKVLVTSPVDVKVSIKDERCVRVRGTINMSGEIPTIRLPEPIENEQNAVFCDTAVKWWSNTE